MLDTTEFSNVVVVDWSIVEVEVGNAVVEVEVGNAVVEVVVGNAVVEVVLLSFTHVMGSLTDIAP